MRVGRITARELLAPVYGWFTEGFDRRNLKDAKALPEESPSNVFRHHKMFVEARETSSNCRCYWSDCQTSILARMSVG